MSVGKSKKVISAELLIEPAYTHRKKNRLLRWCQAFLDYMEPHTFSHMLVTLFLSYSKIARTSDALELGPEAVFPAASSKAE
jgi:hypothetical protein